MNIFTWFQSRMFSRYRAKWLYRRGVMLANLHKHKAALADYTAVIDMAGVPANLRAMALYNRALVYHAQASEAEAIDDLNQVLGMADAVGRVKTESRRKLVRMERTSLRADTRKPVVESRSQGGTHAGSKPKADGMHSHWPQYRRDGA